MRVRRWIAWGLLAFVIVAIGGTALGLRLAGYEKYIVQTGSMEPHLNPGDLIIDKPAANGYQVGDIITFRHGPGPDVVTHRIVDITDHGIKTKGDANRTEDVWTIPTDYVQGVVAFHIPKAGYVVAFLSQPTGIAAVAVAVIGLVILWRLFFPVTGAEPPSTGADDESGEPLEPAGEDGAMPDDELKPNAEDETTNHPDDDDHDEDDLFSAPAEGHQPPRHRAADTTLETHESAHTD